jgi:hypothetical protein
MEAAVALDFRKGKRTLAFVGVVVAVLLIVTVLVGVAYSLSRGIAEPEVALPVLAVSSIILLLGTLSIVSIAFALFGIDDRSQALGLPEGSIRAVIALSLVVLFGILAVYLYANMSAGTVANVPGLSDQQAKSFLASLSSGQLVSDVPDGKGVHTIFFRSGPDLASTDFAKQIMTLLGTLVTAIASFYFGSRSAAQPAPQTDNGGSSPVPSQISPSTAPRGTSQSLSLGGSNLGTIDQVKLKLGADEILAKNVLSNASKVTFDVDIPTDAPLGAWDVVPSAKGVEYGLATAFAISDAQLPVFTDSDGARDASLRRARGGVSPTSGKASLRLSGPVPSVAAVGGATSIAPGFVYHGGPVVKTPQVHVSFWGDQWSTDKAHQERAVRLVQFQKDLLASDFMNVLSQYGVGRGTFVSDFVVSGISGDLDGTKIESTLQHCIDTGQLPEPKDGQTCAMVFLQEGISVNDGSITMCEPTSDDAFGFHSYFVTAAGNPLYFAIIPALDDACIRSSCPGGDNACSLRLTQSQEERQTQVASHEFAEMMTDPRLNAWFDQDQGENGDICNGESAAITISGRVWTVQRIYNKAGDTGQNGANYCLAGNPNPLPSLPGGPK